MRVPKALDRAAFSRKCGQRPNPSSPTVKGFSKPRSRVRRPAPTAETIAHLEALLEELLAVASYAADGTPMLRAIYAIPAERRDRIGMFEGLAGLFERLGTDAKHAFCDGTAHPLSRSCLEDLYGREGRTLRRNFREFAGMNCLQLRAEWRLLSALLLFRKTSLQEHEVAARVGLAPTCLSRAFGERFGVPPVQFRRTFRVPASSMMRTSVPECP